MIDAHAHLPLDHPTAQALLDRLDISVLNICVDSPELGGLDAQRDWYRTLALARPDRFAWVTSFSLQGFGTPGWADQCIARLDADFADGAVGCKVWKNVGMELRDPNTNDWVFVDDARFRPIFEHLARVGRPLLMHIAEPIDAWRPLDETSPHFSYYSVAKQWHWHGRDGVPSHERLIASRDAVVERHPKLRVVGLHFGSQEHDLPAVAERLDRFPNYTIDTAARLGDMVRNAARDHEAVRSFMQHYSGRIIWGVDWVLTRPASALTADQLGLLCTQLAARYDVEHRFLSGDQMVRFAGNEARGLSLGDATMTTLRAKTARSVYCLPW